MRSSARMDHSETRNKKTSQVLSPLTTLPLHLGFVLNKAAHKLRESFEEELKPVGIKPRHYGVLSVIAEAGPLPQHVIGQLLSCDGNTMVAIVDDLEGLGLAKREVHPADRRAYAVCITPAGKKMLAKANVVAERVETAFLAPLNQSEQKQMQRLLDRLLFNNS